MAAPNLPTAQSTAAPAPAAPAASPQPPRQREIRVISHCGLFYWWPVWLVGFIMFLVTATPHILGKGEFMVTVPNGTAAKEKAYTDDKGKVHDAYVLPEGHTLELDGQLPKQPHLYISRDKNLGVFFVAVLLLVVVITNIPLRGLWSIIVIVLLVLLVVLFAFFEVWNTILGWFHFLDIRINAAGYFVISFTLFLLWLIVMLVFDRQIYMIFTPGQVRVRQEIGDAETSFDTTGITVQKQRSDLFRHWILGLGSGDLIVKTSGANPQEIYMPNVLFIGRKVAEIEEMLRERPVVMGRPT